MLVLKDCWHLKQFWLLSSLSRFGTDDPAAVPKSEDGEICAGSGSTMAAADCGAGMMCALKENVNSGRKKWKGWSGGRYRGTCGATAASMAYLYESNPAVPAAVDQKVAHDP